MDHQRATILGALLLTGCAVAVAPAPNAGRAPAARPKASAKPAAAAPASMPPSAAPTAQAPAGPAATTSPAALAVASPAALAGRLVFPTKLLPPLPAYLVGPDGASLVGPDGASLVGPDGASLVGPDGASLVGPDGASAVAGPNAYALRQAAAPTATPSPADGACPPAGIPAEPGKLVKQTFLGYRRTVGLGEGLLAKAADLQLVPGVPQTVPLSFGKSVAASPHTFLLEARGTGGMLRVAKGPAVTPADLVASLAFASADAGDLVLRLTGPMIGVPGPGVGIRVRYDGPKGTSSGDYQTSVDTTSLGLPLGLVNERMRVDLATAAPAGPASPEVRLALASSRSAPDVRCQDLFQKMVVNYLPDGRSAMQLAVASTLAGPLEFLGLDRVRAAAPGPGTGFFIDKDDIYLAGDVVQQELGPVMPTAADIPAALPPLADPAAPFADPVFAHPE